MKGDDLWSGGTWCCKVNRPQQMSRDQSERCDGLQGNLGILFPAECMSRVDDDEHAPAAGEDRSLLIHDFRAAGQAPSAL